MITKSLVDVVSYSSKALVNKKLYAIFCNGKLDIPSFMFLAYEARHGGRMNGLSANETNRNRAYKIKELYEHLHATNLDWRICHHEDLRIIRNTMLHWNMKDQPAYDYYRKESTKLLKQYPKLNEKDLERVKNNTMNQKLSVWFKFFKYHKAREEKMDIELYSEFINVSIPDANLQHLHGKGIGQNMLKVERWDLMIPPDPEDLVFHALTKSEYEGFKSQLMKIDPVYAAIAEIGVESGLRIAAILRDVTYKWCEPLWIMLGTGADPDSLKPIKYIDKGGEDKAKKTAWIPFRTLLEINYIYVARHYETRKAKNQLSVWKSKGSLWFTERGKPVTYSDVRTAFREASLAMKRTIGIDSITPHWLRHTFATWTIIDGIEGHNKKYHGDQIDLRKIGGNDVPRLKEWLQARLGHTSLESTARYITTAMYLLNYGSTGPAVSSYDIKRKDKLIELLHTHAVSRYGEEFDESIFDPVQYAKRLGYAVEYTALALKKSSNN